MNVVDPSYVLQSVIDHLDPASHTDSQEAYDNFREMTHVLLPSATEEQREALIEVLKHHDIIVAKAAAYTVLDTLADLGVLQGQKK
jgi:hypothetical protein